MNHSLYMARKLFSLWGRYTVENEAEQVIFTGQHDIRGWNYDVCDRQGRCMSRIRKELWHLSDHCAIHYGHQAQTLPLLWPGLAIDCIHDAQTAFSSTFN